MLGRRPKSQLKKVQETLNIANEQCSKVDASLQIQLEDPIMTITRSTSTHIVIQQEMIMLKAKLGSKSLKRKILLEVFLNT